MARARKWNKQQITSVIETQLFGLFGAKVEKAAKVGALNAARHLLRRSQKIVPIDTGDLKKSGAIIDESRPGYARYVVTYSQHYAIYVHENLMAMHAPGKQAKFLEGPAQQDRELLQQIVADEIQKALDSL